MRSRQHRSSKSDHKCWQLCEQASAALSLALADCANPILRDVVVERVEPAPDASRLRVVVSAPRGDALQALLRARGYLRRQVAAEINRTRTPELVFQLA